MMQLRDYQQEAVNAAFNYLRTRQGNPLIVLPTGAGKSLVIAEIVRRVVQDYERRVIVLQHRKELIEQNASKIPVQCGVYSAGLNRKQINEPCILAGIQSCYKNALDFGRRHLAIIDEAHLVGDDGMFRKGMFRKFLGDLASVNPDLRVIGLTATPYRTSEGHLTEGDTWSAVAYEANIPRLIADGWLSPLTNKPPATFFDTDSLRVRAGEFVESDMAALFDDSYKVEKACQEILAATADRNSVIVFCSGVNHAHHVAERLGGEVIYGGSTPLERGTIIERFKRRQLKYLCNCDVLTTGFDAPNTDAVVLLRATMSPGLFVQMAGRGFRLFEGKKDCLVLDFGRNVERHGPLDAIDFGKRSQGSGTGEAVVKACPGCDTAVPAGKRVCSCGFRFPEPELRHDETSDSSQAILAEPETFDVSGWVFTRHVKKETQQPSLRVTYNMSGDMEFYVEEWVCLEHEGFARRKADAWWQEHSDSDLDEWVELLSEIQEAPDRIDAAIACHREKLVRRPSTITAIKEGKFWRVLSRKFGEVTETEEDFEDVPF